jgi:hypothetical protein
VFDPANDKAGGVEFGILVFECPICPFIGEAIGTDQRVRFLYMGFVALRIGGCDDGVQVFHGWMG